MKTKQSPSSKFIMKARTCTLSTLTQYRDFSQNNVPLSVAVIKQLDKKC